MSSFFSSPSLSKDLTDSTEAPSITSFDTIFINSGSLDVKGLPSFKNSFSRFVTSLKNLIWKLFDCLWCRWVSDSDSFETDICSNSRTIWASSGTQSIHRLNFHRFLLTQLHLQLLSPQHSIVHGADRFPLRSPCFSFEPQRNFCSLQTPCKHCCWFSTKCPCQENELITPSVVVKEEHPRKNTIYWISAKRFFLEQIR